MPPWTPSGAVSATAQAALAPLILLAYAVPYVVRVRSLRRRGTPVAAWRLACFGLALALLAGALAPPLDAAADDRLSAHMLEHLLIGDLAPLLLVVACTGPVLAPVLRLGAVRRLRVLAHPVVALAVWAADLYLWHLPVAYEAAVRHAPVHALQHACFFAFGLTLWLALLGPLPKPAWFGNAARLGYVVAVWLAGALLANALTWSGTVFYGVYAARGRAAGIDALADQGAAGGIMLVEQTVVAVSLFCWVFLRMTREAEERQQLAELAAARGIALDEQRIARAVAAGRGEGLRRRLRDAPRA